MIAEVLVQKDVTETYKAKDGTEKTLRVLSLVELGEHAFGSVLRYVVRAHDKLSDKSLTGARIKVGITRIKDSFKGIECEGRLLGQVAA